MLSIVRFTLGETISMGLKRRLVVLITMTTATISFSAVPAAAGLIFVGTGNGTIGEYTTSGATVNASLITGLSSGVGGGTVALSGSDLFVSSVNGAGGGVIGEYTTSGATVNPAYHVFGYFTNRDRRVGNKSVRCREHGPWYRRCCRIHHFRSHGERLTDHGVE